jgi:hypothetical protein
MMNDNKSVPAQKVSTQRLNSQDVVIDELKKQPLSKKLALLKQINDLKLYNVYSFSLAGARTDEEFIVSGDYFHVQTLTGSLSIKLNEKENDAIDITTLNSIKTPIYRMFLTNSAQAGKNATIIVGRNDLFESIVRPILDATGLSLGASMQLENIAGTIIDPFDAATWLATMGIVGAAPAANTTLARLKTIADNIALLVQPSSTPAIYNVTMTNANTEYSQALPANCDKFTIKCQDGTAFRLAYVTGKVAAPTAPYRTIDANVVKSEDGLSLASTTLYFACASAGKIIEIEAWS